ncbi:polycomb group protein Psc, partial [Ixodes scapularis]|uniref:polycomb group protein Psc n=1 Tax=Ixodes scapularis TaxID=6945 RepID=UPI001C393EF6
TLVDCLHSFCKVCIVRYLDTSKLCPICDVPVHKSRPLSCLRVDKTLQDIVYKVVPGLYQREMKQRREFYDQYPNAAVKVACLEDRGVLDASTRLIFSPQDTVSVSLEYFTGPTETLEPEDDGKEGVADPADGAGKEDRRQRRFLSCPAAFTVNHLRKFLRTKYALAPSLKIDILHMDDVLCDSYSLMDVAYIYAWKRESPLRLAFRVYSHPAKRPAPADGPVDVDGRNCSVDPAGQQQCLQEHVTAPSRPAPESSAAASVEGDVAQSSASPEKDPGPPALVPRDVLPAEEAADAAVPSVVPATETRRPETPDVTTATEKAAAPGSAQAAAPIWSSSSQQEQRQKVAEPVTESAPTLSKMILSSILDRSSNKITIQTKEVPPAVAQAMSPPRSPHSRKCRRKEQRDAERTLQHVRHQGRPPDSHDTQGPRRSRSRSPERPDGATPVTNPRLDGAAADRRVCHSASPDRLLPETTSLLEATQQSQSLAGKGSGPGIRGLPASPPRAHPQTPRTSPETPLVPSAMKGEEDTRPLDLTVSHRGLPAPAPVRRPVGRPPLALPPMCTPGTAKGTASPSPHRRAAAASPAVSLYQKPAVAVNEAATSPPLSQQHHHHHNHHRSSSRGFLKGANLTCINPDPDAFHPRIVIKNLQKRASGPSLHRM